MQGEQKDKKDRHECPPILYRYLDWSNEYHRKWLTTPEVYFSSPRKFNDPYDCEFPIRLNERISSEFFTALKEAELSKRGNYAQAELTRLVMAERRKVPDKKQFDEYVKKMIDEKIKSDGVVCLSSRKDSIVMWSHYANQHTGICIGIDCRLLARKLYRIKGIDGVSPVRVEYVPEFPCMDRPTVTDLTVADVKELYAYKYQDWRYEEEWRMLIMGGDGLTLINCGECFKEVILGFKISDAHKEEVIQVARNIQPKPRIFQAQRTRQSYALEIRPID